MDYLIPYGPFLEEWKDIFTMEIYQISNYGNIRRTDRKRSKKPAMSLGYKRTQLWVNGKSKMFLVHRLVAIAFIANPENKKTVNHIRGYKDDCLFTQLEWATVSENTQHSYTVLGRLKNCDKTPVTSINIKTGKSTNYSSIYEAAKIIKGSRTNIKSCIAGTRHKHKNCKWKITSKVNI